MQYICWYLEHVKVMPNCGSNKETGEIPTEIP